jgi:hypothetical protein
MSKRSIERSIMRLAASTSAPSDRRGCFKRRVGTCENRGPGGDPLISYLDGACCRSLPPLAAISERNTPAQARHHLQLVLTNWSHLTKGQEFGVFA